MSLPRRPDAVVFDMDGLIFDTEILYRDAMMAAATALGREITPAFYLGTIGLSAAATDPVLRDHFGSGFDHDAFWSAVWRNFYALAEAQLCLKAGVVELLDALDEAGLPCAIATSSGPEEVRHHLAAHDLTERFDTIVARGDYRRGKPSPDPYLIAAARLGVAPERCLALEDSHHGVRAATAAGMMTIMVPDLLEPTDEMRRLCVRISRDLHEVRAMLLATPAGSG